MPAVTQFVSDLVGGVSTQPDVKKFPNQVREANNVMIDPSYGLCKRTGSNFLQVLGTDTEFAQTYWFFYRRDSDEFYLVAVVPCIKDGDGNITTKGRVRVFNSRTLVEATVTEIDNAFDYLDSVNFFDYRSITIQDNSIIVNRNKVVETDTAPTFTPGIVGTVGIRSVQYGANYTITIDGTDYTIKTRGEDQKDQTDPFLSATEILTDLKDQIGDAYNVRQYPTSLEIDNDGTAFTLEAEGGVDNEALIAFQDSVRSINLVPDESDDGRTVKIENTTAAEDDYYVKYNSSTKAWEETVKPGITTSLKNSTMPHELFSTASNQFEFRPIDYLDRVVGDETTNPLPTFVGKRINGVFLTNNRLGYLAGPNVILSASSDYFNFFAKSATTVIDSDPLDINCNSTIPTDLTYALPIPTGIALFSSRQQFILAADQKIYTPSSSYIRQISNYEVDDDIQAVNLGTYQAIISKTMTSSKVYFMQVPDINEPPAVGEVSKVVTDYLPLGIDNMTSSPENDMLALSDRTSPDVYLFRRFNSGTEDLMQAWFKWKLPGNVLDLFVTNDMMFIVTMQSGQTTLIQVDLNQNRAWGDVTGTNAWSNASIDFRTTPTSRVFEGGNTRFYVPYNPHATATGIAVSVSNDDDPGFYLTANAQGTDDTGNFISFAGNHADDESLVVGYKYEMNIEFPEFHYRDGNVTDYSAYLNISRIKFSVGLTGALSFQINSQGREEWTDVQPIVEADYYSANAGPVTDRYFFTVPVHQRTRNFKIRAVSDMPVPTCINMMSWEGTYSPKYYRRK